MAHRSIRDVWAASQPVPGAAVPQAVATLGIPSALAFPPVTRGLQLGQIQIWLDFAFTAACVLLVRGRPFAAGALLLLAVVSWLIRSRVTDTPARSAACHGVTRVPA